MQAGLAGDVLDVIFSAAIKLFFRVFSRQDCNIDCSQSAENGGFWLLGLFLTLLVIVFCAGQSRRKRKP